MQDSNDKGFALYDDVRGVVPEDLTHNSDLNDLFVELENSPVDLLEEPKEFDKKETLDLALLDNDVYNEVRVRSIVASSDAQVGDVFGYEAEIEDQVQRPSHARAVLVRCVQCRRVGSCMVVAMNIGRKISKR